MENPIGVLSQYNDYPATNINVESGYWKLDIIVHDDRHMTARRREAGGLPQNVYIGVLKNESSKQIYWMNNTRPLP